jgi:hypothetical protein
MVIGGTSVTVSNNNIGSITTLLSGATGIGSSIYGIATSATTAVISNNIIGSATTPQSIKAANQSTIGNAQNVYGINIASNGTLTISGNTIANLYSGMTFASGSVGLLRGIKGPGAGGGSISISSNNIFSLSTPQSMTGAISSGSSAHSIVGIDLNSTNASGTSIAGNSIYDLVNTAATGAVSVLGVYFQSGANSFFDRNYIHSLSAVSGTAVLTGINLNYGGPCTIRNNIIRLGTDLAGNSITSNAQINGIIKNSGNGFPCYAYFNTIYISGTGVTAGPAATYCFNVTLHVTEDLRNNIFANTRSGGGTNYAIRIAATGVAPAGLTLNYNDYYVTGTTLGYYNGDIANLAAWKTAVGLDVNSLSVDPQFTSATNLVPLNAALVAGTPISGITTDFAGITRNALTPTIGAYEVSSDRTLNLKLYLEGLYASGGLMNPALDGTTGLPVWGPVIAEHITVELHDAALYSSLIYTATNVPLNTNGTASIIVPAMYNGNYYVSVKQANSIETVFANPIQFNVPTITYDLSDLASKAFGDNLKALSGVYAIYAGDISSASGTYPSPPVKDGVVDLLDAYYIYSSFLNGDFGYFPGDVNGDGVVDLVDAYMVYSNYLLGIYAITP